MKAVLCGLLMMVMTSTGFAVVTAKDVSKCQMFATGFAEGVYSANTPGIQGHEWESSVASFTVNNADSSIDYKVVVSGSNDEGDTWDATYLISVAAKGCLLISYDEVN